MIRYISFVLKLKKFNLLYFRNIIRNFRTLAFDYNQLTSMKKRSCIDKNNNPIPWYTYPAIEYLNNLDFIDKNVFEYGSGNSSLWWKEKCKKIISIEADEKWFSKIQNLANSNFDCRLEIDKKKIYITN
jgi:hypothetical protein